jgi:RNA polymerase sigma-70 factor, ECF subfamily
MQARPTGLNKNREVVTVALRSRIDSELIAAAANGSESAFENLMVRYRPRMFALALRYTRTAEDAEDVVQQTFQKVFLNLSRFQGKSSFSTWLTRIAINESLMFLRRARSLREIPIDDMRETASQELELLDSAPNPEITYLQRETAQQLFSAIAQLTPRLRMAIELRNFVNCRGQIPRNMRACPWPPSKPACSMGGAGNCGKSSCDRPSCAKLQPPATLDILS